MWHYITHENAKYVMVLHVKQSDTGEERLYTLGMNDRGGFQTLHAFLWTACKKQAPKTRTYIFNCIALIKENKAIWATTKYPAPTGDPVERLTSATSPEVTKAVVDCEFIQHAPTSARTHCFFTPAPHAIHKIVI